MFFNNLPRALVTFVISIWNRLTASTSAKAPSMTYFISWLLSISTADKPDRVITLVTTKSYISCDGAGVAGGRIQGGEGDGCGDGTTTGEGDNAPAGAGAGRGAGDGSGLGDGVEAGDGVVGGVGGAGGVSCP